MSQQGLPVSRLINVDIVLTPVAAQAPNLNSCLIVGSSDVIDVEERIRSYANIEEVAADFGVDAPEYDAALLFFGQSPQPNLLFIGRWAEEATNGLLETGAVPAAGQLPSVWTGITTGNFFVYVDGVPYSVSGQNFSAVTNMNGVATVIETALAALAAGATVVWDADRNQFVIGSGTTGVNSTVSFLEAPTATGKVTFAGQPADGNTLTLNGTTTTFVDADPGAGEVLIGGNLAATLANLLTFLRASEDAQLVKFEYMVSGSILYLNAAASGAGGNALTLARVGANMTVSGATLAGGSGVDISHMMRGLSTDGGNVVEGIAAETPVEAVIALDNQSQYWYLMTFASETITSEQILDVAAYIEASDNKHIYGVSSTDANIANPDSTTDIAYLLKAAGYNRSLVQYSQNPYSVASFFGRAVTVNFAGNSTVITMMYKAEPGVVAENLNTTQANAIRAKNANVYAAYNNNTAIVQYGTVASGTYFDDIQDTDWLAYSMQTAIFNLLYTSATKIPQTDAGNHLIANAIEAACAQAVANGTLAPGQWNANGFGQLKQGDYLPKGYYIYAPPIYLQSQADREARKSVPFQVAAKLAGAIHTVDVIVNVNR